MITFECNEITKYLSTSDFTFQILWKKMKLQMRGRPYSHFIHREDGYATNTTMFYINGKITIKHKQDII